MRPRTRLRIESLEPRDVPATFTVTSLLDDGSPGTLRWAVGQANAAAGDDTVAFQAGLTGTITLGGTELLVNDPSGGKATIAGPGASVITVSGGKPAFHLSSAADLSGLTVSGRIIDPNGNGVVVDAGVTASLTDVTVSDRVGAAGAGVKNAGTLTVTRCVITGNEAFGGDGKGAGIYNTGTLTIGQSTFTRNFGGGVYNAVGGTATILQSTLSNYTGGVWNAGAMVIVGSAVPGNDQYLASSYVGVINDGGTLTVTTSAITDNKRGGGLSNLNGGTVAIAASTFTGNAVDSRVGSGAAVYSGSGTVSVTGSTFTGNSGNGAIAVAGGAVTISGSTLTGNSGAAVYFTAGTVAILQSTLSNNSGSGVSDVPARFGPRSTGTVAVFQSTISGNLGAGVAVASGTVSVDQSTLSGNAFGVTNSGGTVSLTRSTVAFNPSGGVWNSNTGTTTISQSTVVNNAGDGVFHSAGTMTVTQSTVAGNSGAGLNVLGGTLTATNTLVVGNGTFPDTTVGAGGTLKDNGGNVLQTPAGYSLDQILAVNGSGQPLLADNGGPTQTVALVPGSPAVGRGVPVPGLTYDQRGAFFILQPAPSAGAFEIQSLTLPPSVLPLVAATPTPGGTVVKVLNPRTGDVRWSVVPFAGFSGAVSVTTADLTGDGVADVIVGAGASGGPRVSVFDGVSHAEIKSFYAFDPGFTGGVFVATGVTGTGDLVVGAGPGGGPQVKVFRSMSGIEVTNFFAYDPGFTGGVRVAVGDVTGDGFADIITSTATGAPHVKVFDDRTGKVVRSFYAFDPGFTGGVNVAVGDMNGDGFADILTGAGTGGGPQVKAFDGKTSAVLKSFYAYDPAFTGGVRVSARDGTGDGKLDIAVAAGAGGGPHVKVLDGTTLAEIWGGFVADAALTGGVEVG